MFILEQKLYVLEHSSEKLTDMVNIFDNRLVVFNFIVSTLL